MAWGDNDPEAGAAPAAAQGGWGDSDPVATAGGPGSAAYRKRKGYGHRADRWIDAGVRGAADFASMGFADEIAAGVEALPALAPGGENYGQAFDRHVADERAIDQADREDLPVTRGIGQAAGFVGTLAGSLVAAPARAAGAAVRPVANALRSVGMGAALGGLGAAGNAEGDLGERAKAAVPGAVVGGAIGAAAIPVTAAVGMGVNALRNRGAPAVERAANSLRGRFDTGAARARTNALRDAGAEPSAVSAMDESGRGYVRAAASRMTPARETVQTRAEAAALNLPDRIGNQARAHLSADPRTPQAIAEDLGTARGATAATNFGAVRGDAITMAPETVQALRTGHGREAIAEAARRERDPEVRAALLRLSNDALDNPSTPITVGMADRISRTLYGRGQAAARAGDNDLAATFNQLADAVRGPARTASTGYGAALDDYAAQSRLMEAADHGEDFLRRNTDEFVAQTPGPGQEGNDLARATARRAVERSAGENISAAPGVARRLADAPEQQARNRALLGDEGAQGFQNSMRSEARVVRDLQDVAPRTGSQTQLRTQDQQTTNGVANAAATVLGGPRAWGAAVLNRLKTAGLSDRDAEALAEVATSPAQLDDLLTRMDRMRPGSGQSLRLLINEAAAPNAGERTQPRPAVEAWVEGQPGAYGASYGR